MPSLLRPSIPSLPITPPDGEDAPNVHISTDDLAVLNALEQHVPSKVESWRRRDAPLDPLLYAAAVASGPHVTKHHYHHEFFPTKPDEMRDWSQWTADAHDHGRPMYVSKQAPRSQRLLQGQQQCQQYRDLPVPLPATVNANPPPFDPSDPSPQVQCLSRARIPTPHGPVYLHLYRNNLDTKEHLAVVIDAADRIRSRTLNAVWSPAESHLDRIVRGANVGPALAPPPTAPLVRLHSECYTGETIGSLRCDCGEQLDEALRRIALAGAGAVVYLRQEGRGIGLLHKLRAYNLQDLGHDTVAANVLLGHRPDERNYGLAAAILRDLGLLHIRLLTNNPDKVRALQDEGTRIVDRVPMVPRAWQDHHLRQERVPGATLIGGAAVHGEDLEKYMRTKVDRMGHMLTLPS